MVSFFSRKSGRSTPALSSSSPRTISPMQAVETLLDSGPSQAAAQTRQPPSSFKYNPTSSAKSSDSVQSSRSAPSPAPVPAPKTPHRPKVSTSLSRTLSHEAARGASPRRPTIQAVTASPSRPSPQRPVRPAEGLFDSPTKALPGPPPTVPLPPTPVLRADGRRMSIIDTRELAPQSGFESSISSVALPSQAPTSGKHNRAASAATPSMSRPADKPLTRQRSSTYHTGLYNPPVTPTHSRRPSIDSNVDDTPKHRPAALKLRTSNITPSPHVSPIQLRHASSTRQNEAADIDSSLAYLQPSQLRRTESASVLPSPFLIPPKFARRRSASTGDAFGFAQQQDLETVPTVQTPQRRPSHLRNKSSTSGMSTSTLSSVTSTPSTAFSAAVSRRSFENLPLPWSTVSAYDLETELGRIMFRQHVDTTLASLAQSSPRLLAPAALRTSISEDARLRAELDRLKDKYDKLLAQRDRLFGLLQDGVRGDRGTMGTLVDALGKVTARCDRIARQVFICNDQIRQIELQGEEHILGSVLLSLRRQNSSASWRSSALAGASQVSPSRATVRDSIVTLRPPPLASQGLSLRAMGGDALSSSSSSSHTPQSTLSSGSTIDSWTPESTPTMSDIVVLQPVKDHDSPSRVSKIADSRRTSTATVISFGNIGRFPVPPHRRTGSDETDRAVASPPGPSDAHERLHERDTIAAFVGRYASPTASEFWMSQRGSYASFSTQIVRQHGAPDDDESYEGEVEGGIVILPPGSARLVSPQRGEMPLSARWPSTPLMIVSDGISRESELDPRIRTGFEPRALPVAPLRLPVRGTKSAKAQSLKIPTGMGRSRSAEGVRRARRGRDTQLETPESILLSLATAELWTKQGYGQA